MRLKNRKNKILTVATFIIAMFLANILQTSTFSFIRLGVEDPSSDKLDNVEIEKFPGDIKEIEENSFIHTINGKNYLAEYITKEDVEQMKKQSDIRDSSENYNQIIDGHGTGVAPPTEEAYDNLVGKIALKELMSESVKASSIASSVDLSSEIYFPAVGDQEKDYYESSSWANGYYAYGYMEAKDNGWDAKSGNPAYLLSPSWIRNKLVYQTSTILYPIEIAQLMTEWGVATLKTMPYEYNDVDSWGNESAWREAPYHRPLDYSLISYEGDQTIDIIKSLLDSGIPVTFLIDQYQYDNGLDILWGDYIFSSGEYEPETYYHPHAQCIVGYDDSVTEDSDIGAFRVVNSYGKYWMDHGYYWLTYDMFKEFGGLSWQQILYYTDRIDYESSLIATWEFDSTPTRIEDVITLGVGPHSTPLDTITPHYKNDTYHSFPTFMALDISEFKSYYDSDHTVNFYLELGSSTTPGVISSFLLEKYDSGAFRHISYQSPDVPKPTPGYVNTYMCDYPIHIDDENPANNWIWAENQDWCSGSGIKEDPYIIKDLIIEGRGTGLTPGILIENSKAYFKIENCVVFNSNPGIYLINTMNGQIIDNDCSNNGNGITLTQSNKNVISENIANNCNSNGIRLTYSNENNLTKNIIKNLDIGIGLYYSSENIITENILHDNNIWGVIFLGDSSDNTIYLNNFRRTGIKHVEYVEYSGSGNSWDNGNVGNYWDDYTGIDYDDDRIGDTPYYLLEPSEVDNYPIWDDGPYAGMIYIDDTAENNWQDAAARYWCSGSGIPDDPYVIQDLIIDGDGSALGSCITIKNSYAYFRIENCTVSKSGFGGRDAGIRLINTRNGQLINNDVSQNTYGIWLKNSDDNIINNNILSENIWSLIIQDSSDNTVTQNVFNDNIVSIIMAGTSSDNTFYSNFFYRSIYDHVGYIDLSYSGSGNSWDNGVVGNYWDDYPGVDYQGDDSIGDTPYYLLEPSEVDNYPLWEDGPIYIDELTGGSSPTIYTWEEASARFWCSGSGTVDDPYVIKDLIIDGGGSGIGISIENSNAYFRIENCIVYHANAGIFLSNINNGKIINNDCSYNNHYGIYLENSHDNIISGNTVNNNEYGIYLESYYYIYINITISGNTANNNTYGIYLIGGIPPFDNFNNCIISGNTANNNIIYGIYLNHVGDLYYFPPPYQNIIRGNTANYNGDSGIYLDHCYSNEVSENIAAFNGEFGIILINSWQNSGEGNYLPNNGRDPIYFDSNSGPVDWIWYTE